ncbi:MAG TPA: class I SAM-dependent methyltransferase [Kofleriaceae bacterium]|nr:class I SAM-dependent methyltransferase [Kofleriaceae bacterium]
MASSPRADAIRAGYAALAGAYRAQLGDELAGKPLDRAFLTAFVERCAGPIADLGCGPGHVTHFLAQHAPHVEGIDLSPEMIAEARRAFPALAFRVADMAALPHADASLAGIVAFYAIVHLRSDELAAPLRECHRVLAPGGLLALAFHAGDTTVHVDRLFDIATALDFTFHPPEAVIAAVTAAGFTLEARLDRQPYPDVEHPSQRTYLLARR